MSLADAARRRPAGQLGADRLNSEEELTMTDTKTRNQERIADWVGDIVALETHVEEAMDKQLKLESNNPELTSAIKRFHDTVRDSKKRAEEYQKQYGSEPGNSIIKAGTNVLGKAAGLIDMVREDSISKSLRDDYTAYNHVAMAYTMLHTTSMALEDQQTKAFAEKGLRTYAKLVQDINHIMPVAVLHDLKTNTDYNVQDTTIVDECRRTIDKIWKQTTN
jgi:ferritin-like metal-binding protein YciE